MRINRMMKWSLWKDKQKQQNTESGLLCIYSNVSFFKFLFWSGELASLGNDLRRFSAQTGNYPLQTWLKVYSDYSRCISNVLIFNNNSDSRLVFTHPYYLTPCAWAELDDGLRGLGPALSVGDFYGCPVNESFLHPLIPQPQGSTAFEMIKIVLTVSRFYPPTHVLRNPWFQH